MSDSTNNFATKDDLKKLASAVELKKVEKNLRAEILKVEERVENVEERLGSVEERLGSVEEKIDNVDIKLDKLQNTLDGFVDRVQSLTEENQVGAHHTRQLRVEVDNHETRIKQLEKSTQTA